MSDFVPTPDMLRKSARVNSAVDALEHVCGVHLTPILQQVVDDGADITEMSAITSALCGRLVATIAVSIAAPGQERALAEVMVAAIRELPDAVDWAVLRETHARRAADADRRLPRRRQ
ncbi:MAG: hypothetical protein AB7N54_20070 [Alphaproteobacteria bacterium]